MALMMGWEKEKNDGGRGFPFINESSLFPGLAGSGQDSAQPLAPKGPALQCALHAHKSSYRTKAGTHKASVAFIFIFIFFRILTLA